MIELTEEQEALSKELTNLQRRLVINYATGSMSQREAYIKAGGKAKTDNTRDASASEIMGNPKVSAFYDSLINVAAVDAIMTREECLTRLTRIARSSVKSISNFEDVTVGRGEDGEEISLTTITFKNSGELTDEEAECISELQANRSGVKLKMHSQTDAMAQLGKMQGWEAPKKVEHGGQIGSVNLSIDSGTNPQKASETYMDMMRGFGEAEN